MLRSRRSSFAIFAATFVYTTLCQGVTTFSTAAEIRSLTAEHAKQAYPVHVRGVITDDLPSPDYFVQDGPAGIFVEGNAAIRHHLGDRVEIDGVTAPGRFAPVIHERKMRVLGPGHLPTGKLHTFREFAGGEWDSQWMQARRIVRTVSVDRTSWPGVTLVMDLASGGGHIRLRAPVEHATDVSEWIGREISFRGVCGSLFNAERQLKGILFYVPRLSMIQTAPAPPLIAIADMLRFTPSRGKHARVRVRGTVTYQQPGVGLFLQTEGFGVRVLSDQSEQAKADDVVEVFGQPATGESAPVLQEATFRVIGHGEPASPRPLLFSLPLERFDGALVQTRATVIQTGSDQILLQSGQSVLSAAVDPAIGNRWRNIPPGSVLDVTGICLVRNGGVWSIPESVRLLLREPADIRVVHAPWWTERKIVWALAIALGTLGAC